MQRILINSVWTALLVVGTPMVRGAEQIWKGTAGEPGAGLALTSVAENWSAGVAPAAGAFLIFPRTAGVAKTVTYDSGDLDLAAVVFQADYVVNAGPSSPTLSARMWAFSNPGQVTVNPEVRVTAADCLIQASGPTRVRLAGGMDFGGGNRTARIGGFAMVTLARLRGQSKKGGILMKTPDARLRIYEVEAGAPPVVVNGGRLETSAESWDRKHLTSIGPNGTLSGHGRVGTVWCSGKVSPEFSYADSPKDTFTAPGRITLEGDFLTPEGESAVVELDVAGQAEAGCDRLVAKRTADFRRADLRLVFHEGVMLALHGSLMLVEVPQGVPGMVLPFRNAPEGWRIVKGGAVYELSYLGGASGRCVTLTRVAVPTPALAITREATAAEAAAVVKLKMRGLAGTRVRLECSPDMESWTEVSSHTLDAAADGTGVTEPMVAGGRMYYRACAVEP